jgi:hypothetical protein
MFLKAITTITKELADKGVIYILLWSVKVASGVIPSSFTINIPYEVLAKMKRGQIVQWNENKEFYFLQPLISNV